VHNVWDKSLLEWVAGPKTLAENPFIALDDEPEGEEFQDDDDISEQFTRIEQIL
jgi:hypothetical protein